MTMPIFCHLECLCDSSSPISIPKLAKSFFKGGDNRIMGQTLQKFLELNRQAFDYLKITPIVRGIDSTLSLSFKTEEFVGVIPIRSPITGKYFSEIAVYPRFTNREDKFREYTELIELIGDAISPEFDSTLPVNQRLDYKPPIYLEGVKFINLLDAAVSRPWQKFQRTEDKSEVLRGQINWAKKAKLDWNPDAHLMFPTVINALSENHNDFQKINYVFSLVKADLNSFNAPATIRRSVQDKIVRLEIRMRQIGEMKALEIPIRRADFLSIKKLKEQANVILSHSNKLDKAWRINYAAVFERAVQYVFSQVGLEIGGDAHANLRLASGGIRTSEWQLKQLEPDIAFTIGGNTYFADAKYKSHLLNRYSNSEFLKEEFRRDLHQILAYSAFESSANKLAFLCYPTKTATFSLSTFKNPLNHLAIKICLIGVPLNKVEFAQVKASIKKVIAEHRIRFSKA